MTLQERLKAAKNEAIKDEDMARALEPYDQIGDYEWARLVEVEGQEQWVVFKAVAKKNFDIDEAIDNFEFTRKEREAKAQKEKN